MYHSRQPYASAKEWTQDKGLKYLTLVSHHVGKRKRVYDDIKWDYERGYLKIEIRHRNIRVKKVERMHSWILPPL